MTIKITADRIAINLFIKCPYPSAYYTYKYKELHKIIVFIPLTLHRLAVLVVGLYTTNQTRKIISSTMRAAKAAL